MVTTFRASEAFAGALELTGKATLVALINRCIGAVIRYMLVAVIPDIFQRLQVVLNVWILAVANETTVRQRRVRRFKVDLVVRVHLLLHIEVETVGVVTFIGHARHHAKLSSIETAEAVAQVFTRRAVETETITRFFFPLIHCLTQTFNNGDTFRAKLLVVVNMLAAEQRVNGFVDADVTQRNRRTTVFEDFRNIIVSIETHATSTFHIEDRGHARFHAFETSDTGHQRLTCQHQTFIQQLPEGGFIAFCFQSNTRQVQADHAEVVTTIVDLLAVFIFPHAEEAAAAHRGFKRTGDFHYLIVVQDIRIHALACALQRQLFDVVVRIAFFMVQTIANRKHQFREHRSFTVFTEACDTVTQDRFLNQARFPAGAQTKTKGYKRRLTVGGVQGVYFVLQRLEGIVALFNGTRVSVAFGVRDVPLFCGLAMFVVAGGDKRCQHFIDTVNGGAAINMAGNLSNNLRSYSGCRRDRLRRFNLGVPHLKALGQHAFQVDQHAVEHREERRVIEIVIVNIATLMCLHHVTRQQVLACIVFSHDPGQQVALGWNHLAVFVGVFVE